MSNIGCSCVSQGSIFGSLLFTWFIKDLVDLLTENKFLFADDSKLDFPSSHLRSVKDSCLYIFWVCSIRKQLQQNAFKSNHMAMEYLMPSTNLKLDRNGTVTSILAGQYCNTLHLLHFHSNSELQICSEKNRRDNFCCLVIF